VRYLNHLVERAVPPLAPAIQLAQEPGQLRVCFAVPQVVDEPAERLEPHIRRLQPGEPALQAISNHTLTDGNRLAEEPRLDAALDMAPCCLEEEAAARPVPLPIEGVAPPALAATAHWNPSCAERVILLCELILAGAWRPGYTGRRYLEGDRHGHPRSARCP